MTSIAKITKDFTRNDALLTPEVSLSYVDLARRVGAMASLLSKTGIGPTSRVGFPGEISMDAVIRFWALHELGAVACPFSTRWPASVVQRAATQAGFTHQLDRQEDRTLTTASPARGNHSTVELATVIFSSGSTGTPKAVAHSGASHLRSAEGANQNLPLTVNDRWLLSLPIYHVAGIGILFRCLVSGAAVAIPSPEMSLPHQLAALQPTHLSVVPTQLKRLLAGGTIPPPSLRCVLLGGAPVPAGLASQAIDAGWPLCTTYGLTEMGSQVTATPLGASSAVIQTAGRTLAHRELRISAGNEILVRGETLCRGYFVQGELQPATNAEGWFETADLGRLDSQRNLIVLGRRDHQFISGGENIHPEEIEQALLDLPSVTQAVVVAIPDSTFGHRPVAFIEGEVDDLRGLRAALENQLPRFKIPDHFLPWPSNVGLKANRKQLTADARRICMPTAE